MIGDSTEEGQGVLPVTFDGRQYPWPERLGQLLRSKYPTDGLSNWSAPSWFAPQSTTTVANGWTNSGWSNTSYLGPDSKIMRSTAAGNTLTFTTPVGVTDLDLIYVGGSGVTGFTVAVDGGAASAAIVQTGSVKDGYKYSINGLAAGSAHPIVITSVGTNSFFDGLIAHYGSASKGIQVFNFGRSGSKTGDYLPGGAFGDWIKSGTTTTSTLCGPQAWSAINPDLIIMGWGYNDANNSLTKAQLKANLATITATLRIMLAPKVVPVIYLSKWAPNASWASGKPMNDYSQITAACAEAAVEGTNTLALDLSQRIPAAQEPLSTAYGLHVDTVHGSNSGYQMIADDVFSVLAA